jgi:hypothetical protein
MDNKRPRTTARPIDIPRPTSRSKHEHEQWLLVQSPVVFETRSVRERRTMPLGSFVLNVSQSV